MPFCPLAGGFYRSIEAFTRNRGTQNCILFIDGCCNIAITLFDPDEDEQKTHVHENA
jgi:hypothetical protein